ncbi:hypothetical protein [Streptomyces pinistramenti]|uniref:hypothetical protein n=1 Tax=Streptomyces pinistramenti TaxID=2884812 RepID=UPI001D0616ED|nr:hypothetical protein [Streptomyces pinistramenti]MCB5907342.1 hypothetical protein [Streptomyces pinistramenti]
MPAASRRSSASVPPAGGLRIRLPWWALGLPVDSFVVLLSLTGSAAPAGAAPAVPGLARLLEVLARLIGATS